MEVGLREGTNDEGMEVERWCKVLKYRLSTSNRPTKGILYLNLAQFYHLSLTDVFKGLYLLLNLENNSVRRAELLFRRGLSAHWIHSRQHHCPRFDRYGDTVMFARINNHISIIRELIVAYTYQIKFLS